MEENRRFSVAKLIALSHFCNVIAPQAGQLKATIA
jgi:hypothetical protein